MTSMLTKEDSEQSLSERTGDKNDAPVKLKYLLNWCAEVTRGYPNVNVNNFTTSWKDGLAFCAIINKFRPEILKFSELDPINVEDNHRVAFEVAEQQLGVPSLLDPHDLAAMSSPDRLSVITYVSQLYNLFGSEQASPTTLIEVEEITYNQDVTSDERVDVCYLCNETVYLLEKLTISDKCYHRSCYRATQLNRIGTPNGIAAKSNSPDNISPGGSPSPVRTAISSPYSPGTLKPPVPFNSNDGFPTIKRGISPAPPRPPLPAFLQSKTPMKVQTFSTPNGTGTQLEPDNTKSYPDDLNPFGDDEATIPQSGEGCDSKKNTTAKYTGENPFDAFGTNDVISTDDLCKSEACRQSPITQSRPASSMSDVRCTLPVRHSRPTKRRAPQPPSKSQASSVVSGTSQSSIISKNSLLSEYEKTHSSMLNSLTRSPSASPNHRRATMRRFSSVGNRFVNEDRSSRQNHAETQSMVIKRAAPSLPVHEKRTIRADPTKSRIGYTTLHAQLYEVNNRLNEVEKSARAVQMAIKKATEQHVNTDSLLTEWLRLVQKKDVLFKQESELLQTLRSQELEDRHAELEHELRLLLAKQNIMKTPQEKVREEELLHALLQTVNKRAELSEAEATSNDEKSVPLRKAVRQRIRKIMCMGTASKSQPTLKIRSGWKLKRCKTKSRESVKAPTP